MVDAENFTKIAPFLAIAVAQVRGADGLIVNKADRCPSTDVARLQEVLRGLNPDAPQRTASFGDVDEGFYEDLVSRHADGQLTMTPPADLFALSFESEASVDRPRFMETLREFGPSVLRFKGNVNFSDGRRFVEIVHDRLDEHAPAEGLPAATACTVIAWKTDREAMKATFDRALCGLT